MVRALLSGTKTQTRRIVKPQPGEDIAGPIYCELFQPCVADKHGNDAPGAEIFGAYDESGDWGARCPYGQPSERLWVRESHWWFKDEYDHETGYSPPPLTIDDVEYRADGDDGRKVWRPSIHMPRWASRITLEITDVRVVRLNDISETDARAEGITDGGCLNCGEHEPCGCAAPAPDARDSYINLWEQINGAGSWDLNPWVWVVEFKQITKEQSHAV